MNDLEEFEIGLLYKSLVLLKDKEVQEIPNSSLSSKEEDLFVETVKTEEETPPLTEESAPETLMPKLLIYSKQLENELMADNSNLNKILQALNSSEILTNTLHLEDLKSFDRLKDVKVVWSIGLSKIQQDSIRSYTQLKYLNSPNPESLQSKEDKREMYEPLKAFVKYFS